MDLKSQRTLPAFATLHELLSAVQARAGFAPLGAALREAEELPEGARRLLAHDEHMTQRLRDQLGCELELHVLRQRRENGCYAREILLLRGDTGQPVEFGIVRIQERCLPAGVMDQIVAERRPRGDILIASVALRRVEPRWYFEFEPGAAPSAALAVARSFGRVGVIHCDDQPAVEVLEAVGA